MYKNKIIYFKLSKIVLLLFLSLVCLFNSTFSLNASEYRVFLGGDSIGLVINAGVYVTGLYDVETSYGSVSPWDNSNIKVGDRLVEIENQEVNNGKEVQRIINSSDDELEIVIERKDKKFNTEISVVVDKNNKKTIGLYLKDETTGIGTLTFVYKNSFASLAHSVNNEDNNYSNSPIGFIKNSNVIGIRKASKEEVGEKKATIVNHTIGKIYKNCKFGVYGKVDSYSGEEVEVAKIDEIKLSNAQILTVINGNKKEYFDCEIISLSKQNSKDVKGIKLKITDEELIEKCGGIVQGMSGSPIVQNGKLVGAVSHVSTNNPKIGYALYAEWMFSELV